ncbi:MAG: FtsK/SpoIIIE domain-containing protein, partial [Candidatus Dadabacteria bacterium]|nr:FtsK/SpoIIIE domain-containing protein [Candidatus Dadabacteria bacterium]
VDLVFLQDVIARNAKQKWFQTPVITEQNFLKHVPSRWSRRRPIAKGDATSAVYLTSPAQPKSCKMYLSALYRVIDGGDSGLTDVIPARETNFRDSGIKKLLDQTHEIADWVVNYDELADRRLLRNVGINVIRHINDRSVDRNIVVSTTSRLDLLQVLLQKRLQALNLDFSKETIETIADSFIARATNLSGQLVLRAARDGRYSNELLGVVLSMERLSRILQASLYIGWYFLDDFATWFGQKEEKIADIMAIAPCIEEGRHILKLAISEAKYVSSKGYQTHVKKSAQQLAETFNRISRALNPERNRIDKDIWLHRIGDLMIENMEPCNDLPVSGWSLHKWSEEVRSGSVPILVMGFSHVFIHDEDVGVNTHVASIRELPHCQQIVLDYFDVRDEIGVFTGKQQNSDIPEEAKKNWHNPLISKTPLKENRSVIDKQGSEVKPQKTMETPKKAEIVPKKDDPERFIPQDKENENIPTDFSEPDFSHWPQDLRQWLRDGLHSNISTEKDVEWLHETGKSLQRALRGYDMTAEIRSSRLTPNAALVRFRGTDDLTVSKIEKRKQELLTSHSIDVINVLPAPGEIIVMVKRPSRAVISLRDLWRKRELLGTVPPQNNASLLLGMCEEDGELLYLNLDGEFAGYQEHGPHTLIAGETGSGKGVLIQNLLLDICATNSPQSARVRMIDPKAGIDFPWLGQMPHLDRNLVTSQQDAICSIEELVDEMERRYQIFADIKVQKLGQYNRQVSLKNRLPRIWLFHDEMADWMLSKDYREEVEKNVTRLGVKARAAGIHLVLITQRPDKEAMPVHLRANLANRLVLKVADRRNSELVLDESGAEKLLGRGHLAAKLSGEGGRVILAQVPFASNDEITMLASIIVNSWQETSNCSTI